MTDTITVEFFHDTICSFCFPMSYKMRKVKVAMPNLTIIHRSFALVRQEIDFDYMFHSREQAKQEVLTHWEQANKIDPLHRFNIAGMRKADFLFPISMPALYACKAAYFVSGDAGYWDLFDRLQYAFFAENRNIQLNDVIYQAVDETNLNKTLWEEMYHSVKVKQAVDDDLRLAERYGIHEVPTLVVNGTHKIRGAIPVEELMAKIKSVAGF